MPESPIKKKPSKVDEKEEEEEEDDGPDYQNLDKLFD